MSADRHHFQPLGRMVYALKPSGKDFGVGLTVYATYSGNLEIPPSVLVSGGSDGLSINLPISPRAARELAANLVLAADRVEQLVAQLEATPCSSK